MPAMKHQDGIDDRGDMPVGPGTARGEAGREPLEEELAAALGENAILRKELCFRLRNCLQSMGSLARLQIAATRDPCARKALRVMEWRLRALSISNCMSLDWRDADEFELPVFLRELTAGLLELDHPWSRGLGVELSGNSVRLGIGLLIPIGTITAEALSIFLDTRQGATGVRMGITWSARDGGGLSLRCRADGGFPKDVAPRPLEAIDMEIIRAVAEQVDATVAIANEGDGDEIRMDFRAKP